jgi:rfaE bifunctional protein kinase chain/domain
VSLAKTTLAKNFKKCSWQQASIQQRSYNQLKEKQPLKHGCFLRASKCCALTAKTNTTSALQKQTRCKTASVIDGILLEDYNKGVLTTELIEWIIAEAKALEIPVVVDPKKKNFFAFKGCTLFKPNLKELKEGLQIDFDYQKEPNALNVTIEKLQQHIESDLTFVTLSEHGVQLYDGHQHHYHPAHLRKISDVSGAGDTVIATTCLCLICGASPNTIAAIANLAGGLVCEQSGVVSINKQKLLKEALQFNS